MNIYIDIDEDAVINSEFKLEDGKDFKEAINEAICAAHKEVKCPYDIEVNVMITDNNGIHEINRDTRDIDRPTDVLSFPTLEYDEPGDFSNITDKDVYLFNPETNDTLSFYAEEAWGLTDFNEVLAEHFPDIKIYWVVEESGEPKQQNV